jgi:hypothetical protein
MAGWNPFQNPDPGKTSEKSLLATTTFTAVVLGEYDKRLCRAALITSLVYML